MAIQINVAGLQQFEQAVDRLSTSLDKAEAAMRQMLTSGSAIDRLYGGMTNFKEFMQTLNNLNKTGLSGLRAVTTGMRDLAKAVGNLPASGPSTRFFADLKDMLTIIQNASLGARGSGQTFNLLKDFVKNMKDLTHLTQGGVDTKKMSQFIRDFGQMMLGITRTMQVGSRLSDFDTVTAAIARFGAGLKKIMIEFNSTDLNPGKLGKKMVQIFAFTQTLGLMMRSLPSAVGSGANSGSALDQFSFMIDRLGRGFRGLASVDDVGFKKGVRIVKFLGTLALGLRVISKLPGNIQQAESFSRVISAVFGAIERVSKLTVNEGRFGKMVFVIEKPLKQLIGTILPLIERLTKIKSKGADLDGMARVMQALGIFFERMEKVKIRPNDFKGFKSAIRELADGLNQLDRVRIDTRKLNSIGSALEGMAKTGLSVRSLRGAFEKSGFNLGNEIKRGIILAGFNQFFHRLFVGSLRNSQITNEAHNMGGRIGDAIKRGLDFTVSVIRGLREIGDTLRDVGDRFMQFGVNLNQRFGLGALIEGEAFKAATGFEAIESQLRVFGGLTEEQIEQAKEFANQIGIDYPLSANEALAATLDLIKAGQNLSSTEFILPAAADLAALSESGSIEASTTALIAATGAFEEFRDGVEGSFENVSVATDIIAAGGDVSIASIDGINDALANVGPAAASAGQNLEETVAIIAQLADAGIQGADAGTGLKSALNSIVRPQSINELNRLGIAAYDAEGNFAGLGDIAGQLSERYDELGYTEQQRTASLSRLADTYGRTTLQILMANGGIDHTIEAMRQMEPASIRAQQLLDNFNGDAEKLSGSLETLSTNVILPMLRRAFRPLVQGLTTLVNAVLEANPAVVEFISNFVLIGSTLATVIGAVAIAVGGLIYFGGVIATVASGILAFALAPGLAVAALGGLIASFAALVAVGTVLIGGLSVVATFLTEFFSLIENNVGGAGDALSRFRQVLVNLRDTIGDVISNLGGIVTAMAGLNDESARLTRGERVAGFFNNLSLSVQQISTRLTQINGLLTGFRGFLEFGSDLQSASDAAASASTEFTNMRQTMLRGSVDRVSDEYAQLLRNMTNNPLIEAMLGEDVTEVEVERFFYQLRAKLQTLIQSLRDIGAGLMGMLFNVEGAETQLRGGLNNLLNLIAREIQNRTDINLSSAIFHFTKGDLDAGALAMAEGLFDSLRQTLLANEGTITDILTGIFNYLTPGRIIMPLADLLGLDEVGRLANSLFGTLEEAFRRLVGTVFDLLEGQSLEDALVGNFGPAIRPVIRLINGLARVIDTLVGVFRRLFETLFPRAGGAVGGSFLEVALNGISSILEGFATLILTPLSLGVDLFRLLGFHIGRLWEGIKAGFPAAWEAIQTFLGGIGSDLQTKINDLKLAEKIGDLIGGLKDAIGGLDLGTAVSNAAQGIADVINRAIVMVPDFIHSLGTAIGSTLLTQFGEDLKNEDFGTAVSNLAQGLAQNIWAAIQQVPALISNLLAGSPPDLSMVPTELLYQFDRAEAVGSAGAGSAPSGLVQTLQTTITNAFNQAVEGIALSLLSNPLTRRLAIAIAEGDWSGVLHELVFGTIRTVKEALTTLPKAIAVLGDALNIDWLVNFGIQMDQSLAFAIFVKAVDVLSRIPATALTEVVSALKGFGDFWVLLSGEEQGQVAAVTAITTLLGAIAAVGAKNVKITGIKSFFTALKGGLVAIGGKIVIFAAIVAGFLTITSVMENLKYLAEGDTFTFLVETITSIAEGLSDLVGLEFDGVSFAENTARGLIIIERALDRILENIRRSMQNFINDAATLSAQILLSFRPGDPSATPFFTIQELFGKEGSAVDFAEVMRNFDLGVEAGAGDAFRTLLRSSADEIVNGFSLSLMDAASERGMSNEDFSAMMRALLNSEAINDPEVANSILRLPPDMMASALSRMFSSTELTDEAKTNLYHNVVDSLEDAMLTGAATRDDAINLMALLTLNTEMTPEERDKFLQEINALMDGIEDDITPVNIMGRITELVPTDFSTTTGDYYANQSATINVRTDVEVISDAGFGTNDPNQALLDRFIMSERTGEPLEIDTEAEVAVNVTDIEVNFIPDREPSFEVQEAILRGPVDPNLGGGGGRGGMGSKIHRMNVRLPVDIEATIVETEVDNAETALDGLQTKVSGIGSDVQIASGSFAGFAGSAAINALIASTVWGANALLIMGTNLLLRASLDGIAGAVGAISTAVIGVRDTISENAPLIAGSFQLLYDLSKTPLDNLILKLEDVETAALNVGTALTNAIPGLGVTITPEDRATGGPVVRSGIYRVTENGQPEVLEIGNDVYLLPGGNGTITPLQRQVSAPPPRLGNGGGYGGGLIYQEGDININVNAPAGMNVEQLSSAIEQKINRQRADNQSFVRRELVRTGRI